MVRRSILNSRWVYNKKNNWSSFCDHEKTILLNINALKSDTGELLIEAK